MGMYKLTDSGLRKVNFFINECEAKRKEILDARLDTADDTIIPTVGDILSDIEFALDEEGNYYNAWGVTDNYNSDNALYLNFGEDFILREN